MGILVNGEYKYRLDDILKCNPDIALIFGGRSIGKTYSVREKCLKEACKNPDSNKFIYLRRYAEDIKSKYVKKYFNSKDTREFVKKFTKGKYDRILVKNEELYVGTLDENYKEVYGYSIGYTLAVALDERYKSLDFDDVSAIIFEEWQTLDMYLSNEPERVKSILSTVKRDRNNVILYMVCNTINIVSPYIADWDLNHLEQQKQGTIEIYKMQTGDKDKQITIVCEYCGETSKGHTFITKNGKGKMETTGQYYANNYPNYKFYDSTKVMYIVVFEYDNFRFLMRLINDRNRIFWYVERKTTDIKENTRIISNNFYFDNLYTNDFIGLNEKESKIFSLIKMGKIAFSNNLTGTQFYTCLKSLRR